VVAKGPDYAEYQSRTTIPVVVLDLARTPAFLHGSEQVSRP
jgi:hypothetical protein